MNSQYCRNLQEAYLDVYGEDYKSWDFGPKQKAQAKFTELAQKKAEGNSVPGTATRANAIASVARDMRTTLDKNSAATGTNPVKQGLQPATQRHTAAALRGAGGGMTASKVYDVKPLKPASRPTRGGSSSSAGAGSVSSISGGSSYDVGGQTPSRGFGLSGIKLANSYEPDLYDVILEYLLDEGYADTVENAESIMVNMSEDWRESIAENVTSGKSRVRNVQPKPTGPISNSERQSRIDADNNRIKKAGDEAHATAISKGLGFSDAQARRTAAELRLKREIAKSYR